LKFSFHVISFQNYYDYDTVFEKRNGYLLFKKYFFSQHFNILVPFCLCKKEPCLPQAGKKALRLRRMD